MTKRIGKLRLNRETVRQLNLDVPGTAREVSAAGCESRIPCPVQSYYAACPLTLECTG